MSCDVSFVRAKKTSLSIDSQWRVRFSWCEQTTDFDMSHKLVVMLFMFVVFRCFVGGELRVLANAPLTLFCIVQHSHCYEKIY